MSITRFALIFLVCLPALVGASSEGWQDASQLFRQGRHTQALAKIDAYLAANPKDAQGRFLKGLILTELNRYQEAIKVFSDLTADYPQLPEPYNNLAVLYAAQGQYERAKQSLEQAIRTHPSYATAHENLGDVYAKMASLAYDKALQLDASNVSAQTKLALIRELFSPTRVADAAKAEAARPSATRSAAKPAARAPAGSATVPAPGKEATSTSPEPAGSGEARKAVVADSEEVRPDAALADATGARTQSTPETPAGVTPLPAAAASPPAEAKAAIEKTIRDWAQAWSRQDVAAYLAFYGKNFVPPHGIDRSAWEAQRRQRLLAPKQIKVQVSNLSLTVTEGKATAKFKQRYEAEHLQGTYNKTLELELQDGQWKIISER